MRRPAAIAGLLAIVVQLASAVPGAAPVARGAEFRMDTQAAYDVRPADRYVAVSVDVTFENTTPDPAGQFSLFEEVKLAIHDQAADVEASDADGALDVTTAREEGVNVATVELREGLRHEEVARFTVDYRLPDGDDPSLRVRPSLVVFSAWGFGTRSSVTVALPAGYEVRVDGDPLTADRSGAGTRLSSGRIASPTRWLALVTAQRPTSFVTLATTVPLNGGTADLQVRAFADDEEWGERTLALLRDALPRMEEAIGLPYRQVGPLVVTESVETGVDGFIEDPGGDGILVAFDQPGFTALHQVAHTWLNPELIEARWIREGLASYVAERVGAALDVDPPYEPAAEREALADAAIPLDAWGGATADAEQDRYGYAASWALMNDLAREAGPEVLQRVLQRVAGGIGPYQPSASEGADVTGDLPTLDSRAFLDHLEQVSGTAVAELFGEHVFDADDAGLLDERAAARERFDELVNAAGEWGIPDPVRAEMRAWQFGEATTLVDAALAWIERRDELLAEMQRLGLSAPARLRMAYVADGGGPDASTELAAEAAVVDAYAAALERVNAARPLLARFGLLGAPDPSVQLTAANGFFADGDLRAAADAIADAERQLSDAETTGLLRLASLVAAIVLLVAFIVVLLRRRRTAEAGT